MFGDGMKSFIGLDFISFPGYKEADTHLLAFCFVSKDLLDSFVEISRLIKHFIICLDALLVIKAKL